MFTARSQEEDWVHSNSRHSRSNLKIFDILDEGVEGISTMSGINKMLNLIHLAICLDCHGMDDKNGTSKVNRDTHGQTHRQTDISTYRKHRPRGPML